MFNFESNHNIAKTFLISAILFLTTLSFLLISNFSPFIPDYDGLDYFTQAERIRAWLMDEGNGWIRVTFSSYLVKLWPITNGPSVVISALFMRLIHPNFLPSLISLGYLVIFSIFMVRIRSSWYTFFAIILVCSNVLFFRLFTTLTSEFSVGLWMIAFLVILNTDQRRSWWLPLIVITGILLRSVNIVFIVGMAFAFVISQMAIRKQAIAGKRVFIQIFLTLLVTAPLFFDHYRVAFDYMKNVSLGLTAQSWKSVGGVSETVGVASKYLDYLLLYNYVICIFLVGLILISINLKQLDRRKLFQIIFLSTSITLPLFFAQSLNVQIVFWIFSAMIFMIVEICFLICGSVYNLKLRSSACIVIACTLSVTLLATALISSWKRETRYLSSLADVSGITRQITQTVKSMPDIKYVSANFRGVGPLDTWGLNFESHRNFEYAGVHDIYTKGIPADHYLAFDHRVNLFISAHRNYFFAPHFGINDVISETNQKMEKNGESMGFRKIRTVSDTGKFFDLWYRPGVATFPEFRAYHDFWISQQMPLTIGSEDFCRDLGVSGTVVFDLEFPQVAENTHYAPPFSVELREYGQNSVVSVASIKAYGRSKVVFDLDRKKCGNYSLHIAQSFSTVKDPRLLSALLHDASSALKFDTVTK